MFEEFESLKGCGSVPCSVFRVPRCGIGGFEGFEELGKFLLLVRAHYVENTEH